MLSLQMWETGSFLQPQLYHQVRVGRQLLANEGSVSTNIQLEEYKYKLNCETIIQQEEKVWEVNWPRLCTGILCRCLCNPLKDLIVAEEALGSCSAFHVMDEGFL